MPNTDELIREAEERLHEIATTNNESHRKSIRFIAQEVLGKPLDPPFTDLHEVEQQEVQALRKLLGTITPALAKEWRDSGRM